MCYLTLPYPVPSVACILTQFKSILNLDPELQLTLPIVDRHSSASAGVSVPPSEIVKKPSIVLEGRVMNFAEIVQQLKQKASTGRAVKQTKKVNNIFLVIQGSQDLIQCDLKC